MVLPHLQAAVTRSVRTIEVSQSVSQSVRVHCRPQVMKPLLLATGCPHSLPHSRTHSLNHSLNHSFIHSPGLARHQHDLVLRDGGQQLVLEGGRGQAAPGLLHAPVLPRLLTTTTTVALAALVLATPATAAAACPCLLLPGCQQRLAQTGRLPPRHGSPRPTLSPPGLVTAAGLATAAAGLVTSDTAADIAAGSGRRARGRRQGRGEEGGRSSSRGPVRTWQDCAQRSISSSLPKLQDARADDDDLLLFFCTLAAFDWEIISVPLRHTS